VGCFWPRIYVCIVKKGHARDIYFLLQTRNFWYFSAPSSLSFFSLYVLLSVLASAFHWLCWLSHIKLRSGRSADLRSLRWYSIERLAGVGYMRIVHRVMQGKIFRFALHLKWKNLFAEVQVGGQSDHERQTHTRQKPLFPTDLQNRMPHLDVCDPSDCRVAFISRGQSAARSYGRGQRRKFSPVVALPVDTGNQQAVDGQNRGAPMSTCMRSTGWF
jgi:hypothetical protein